MWFPEKPINHRITIHNRSKNQKKIQVSTEYVIILQILKRLTISSTVRASKYYDVRVWFSEKLIALNLNVYGSHEIRSENTNCGNRAETGRCHVLSIFKSCSRDGSKDIAKKIVYQNTMRLLDSTGDLDVLGESLTYTANVAQSV